jgi:hypothetical protein
MGNPMYPLILEEMIRALGVSKRQLETDIKDIAEYWETCLQKAAVNDRDTAIFLLTTCAACYLKGRGVKLGNIESLRKNNGVLVTFVTLVPLYVWKQPGNYPKIHELIPIEVYKGNSEDKNSLIIAQAEEILRKSWGK